MIPKECKRLAEVDFPIAVVSKHAAREKSIRHGHPSTLHLWWARRPLAACRAMLLALLFPDPCDENCPAAFKTAARQLLPRVSGRVGPSDLDLREALKRFIGDFANWDLSADATFLEVARGLVRAAYPDEPPLVVDPFAGGGSIPLEALRVGCDAFASDLNPVACLILKVMLEDIPRHGPALADQLREAGKQIRAAAERELGEFYPPDPDGARPIAYLWARTVQCEAPNCGAEIPLARSFWLSKKANRKRALKHRVVRSDGAPRIEFEIFEPRNDREVPSGTVTRAKATCVACKTVLPPERVRAQLAAQRGGANVQFDANDERIGGARLLGIVTLRPGMTGRNYRLAEPRDYAPVGAAMARLAEVTREPLDNGLSIVPDEPTPTGGGSGAGRAFSVQKYGMMQWGDLFTARQKLALATLRELTSKITDDKAIELAAAAAFSRAANAGSSLSRWHTSRENHEGVFSRQALPIVWDYSESNPLSESTGGFAGGVDWVIGVADAWPGSKPGQVSIADAADNPLPDDAVSIWFTDPPYYDAIPYADLADFFFVWLKRWLDASQLFRDPHCSENALTPKARELVQDETKFVNAKPKDRSFFEHGMGCAFTEGRRVLRDGGIGAVVFAHKTTEGWEALLSGIIAGGFTITASWPIATEMGARLRARDSAALATSVHLVCRPRPENAPVGDWIAVIRELPVRVAEWMERLQSEGVRGADLVFACIGPALEIYSRYSKVLDAEDREIPLGGDPTATEPHQRGYLAYVWEVVGRAALEQVLGTAEARARNGAAGALEEDARLTALFLWTIQSTSGISALTVDAEALDDEQASALRAAARRHDRGKGRTSWQRRATDGDEHSNGEEDDDGEGDDGDVVGPLKGFTLVYDVVRRFAQPLGIRLQEWEGRVIETKKGVVRLLPVSERARQLFGEAGAQTAAAELERDPARAAQLGLFSEEAPSPKVRGRRRRVEAARDTLELRREPTTLDRVHAAMLLQRAGQTAGLRALIAAEVERGQDFLRLANALSALYPAGSEEKRLVDAMLLAVPRR
ncbi:MAG: DUF1156 domain-containing protein [Longimicrobiales bacterium]